MLRLLLTDVFMFSASVIIKSHSSHSNQSMILISLIEEIATVDFCSNGN